MIDFTHLTPDSTLYDLPWHQFEVASTTPGQVVAAKFEQSPDLPGVIITAHSRLVGIISRRKFYETISLHPSIKDYQNRPIQGLLNLSRIPPLILNETCPIPDAANIAISRSQALFDEPVVMVSGNQSLGLIDIKTLLLAQSFLFKLVEEQLKLRSDEFRRLQAEMEVEQGNKIDCHQILHHHKKAISLHTKIVQKQKYELNQKNLKIQELNQRLLQIGQLLALEAKNAFQATLVGVNSICSNTDQMVEIGKTITQELERVNTTSRLMGEIIQNVRQLAVDAVVEPKVDQGSIHLFPSTNLEMVKLVGQTFEVNGQINQIATRLRVRVQELTASARGGASLARSLIYKLERAQGALSELETFVGSHHPPDPELSMSENVDDFEAVEPRALREKIEQAERVLIELENLVKNQDLKLLIQKIEETLRRHSEKISQAENALDFIQPSPDSI